MKAAIYGAGEYGKAFFKGLKKGDMNIDCFIDQYTSKKIFMDLPVYKIEDIEDKELNIYISVSLNNNLAIPDILNKNGFKNIHSFTNSLEKYPNILSELMKTNILWMREQNSEYFDYQCIDSVYNLLSDKNSKQIYKDTLEFRKTLDMRYYIFPDSDLQYFPNDTNLKLNINSLSLVDCGAYIGDTVKSAMYYASKNNIKVKSIFSFEADQTNINKLNKEIIKQQELFPHTDFIVYLAGIWSHNTILYFSNDGNSASSICEKDTQNSIKIPVFNLDSTLQGANPNYIKMDIEGAEQEAIKGAKELIKKLTPHLAISVYHKPKDLWEIPLLIDSINPNYDMHLRVYGHLGRETILYCIPKDNNQNV